ncbi:kinesin-like protein KIF11-A [Harmonia axyridis]|uniref:kinesin-like protein KIF11-A n=1 Tax=Harmonia axyridis TaxID=115357 RepID=UPI001E27584D|nr:kinesin-like protein KIF11-A [Harmonia axyridis]
MSMSYNEYSSEFFDSIDENHLHIYLRIKDGITDFEDLYEVLDPQTIISKQTDGCNLMRNTKDDVVMKKYKFTKIFGPDTKQIEIFKELVKPKLVNFINGHNSTLLTYGVSSSGKTYTVVGTAEKPGVIPRSLEYLFRTLPVLTEVPPYKPLPYGKIVRLTENEVIKERHLKKEILNSKWTNSAKCEHINTYCAMQSCMSNERFIVSLGEDFSGMSVGVWVSFAEIYNEHVYDLLRTKKLKKEKLKMGSANGETYLKNLTLVHVTSGMEAYQVLQYGLHHLNYAKTNINNHSSRSHSVFTIWLTQAGDDPLKGFVSHFNFCDLAGAERSKKTLNVGDRLKESNNINTSLLVLARCISAVRKAQYSSNNNIIPFRESKLTQLFQKALSGLEDICMVVTINPCRELLEETQHVLNFSAIAKDIVVDESPLMISRRSERITQFLRQRLDNAIGTETANGMEELKNELAEIVSKMEMEDMNQMKEIEMMRNHIISEYNKKQEEQNEEMEFEILALKKRMMNEHKKQLQAVKLEMMQKYGISDDESVGSSCSSAEVIHLSSDEESDSAVETTNLVRSDDEEEVETEDEIDKWRKKVCLQEELIAEHHKTISCLRRQIDELKLRIEILEIG